MDNQSGGGRHENTLASRKAEEAALRRYQASHWLECLVGPLGIPSQPSEREFISCLRNGLVLCKLMNKVQPGSVPKVVVNQSASSSQAWDSQPLPAYQYFENVRNFLVAIEALKLPAFDASIFERDSIQEGSSAKVVDCILALKAYHEWQQMTGGNGVHKPLRSPFVVHLSGRANMHPAASQPSDCCQQLDESLSSNKQPQAASVSQKLQELVVKALAEHMVETKENIDHDVIGSFQNGKMDTIEFFGRLFSNCLEQQIQKKYPELKSENRNSYKGRDSPTVLADSTTTLYQDTVNPGKSCRACLRNGYCKHWDLVDLQEKELQSLKALLSSTKKDFKNLQRQLEDDLKQVGAQVQEMSLAAQKYHKVVEENRSLYNMVQDLKGNIRVYCRIRPTFNAAARTVIDFIGQDGSLVVVDPLKLQKDGRKNFQFNHVFGPVATQDEVFREIQPLIRSVMDGYNVCIFAYGQTGSGKTYTMCGPSVGSTAEQGINYLALNDLFQLAYQRRDIIKYEMHVQMVEIYNEQVRDLLAEDLSVAKLEIRSCSNDNELTLPGASIHHVTSTADVISLMTFGQINRAVGSTSMNAHSSRSHSVLTIHVRGEDVSGSKLHSCLHLVDLAGSERVLKSGVTGEGLKEAQHINKSLSCLGDVIMALAQKNSHIPYRNSKLTLLLQNALGGHAKTLMFAHVSPEEDSFGETMSTLKFAQRVSTVELGAACVNKESSEVLELKSEIESLRAALGYKELTTPKRSNPKESLVKTPNGRPTIVMERTPPRSRRLSIENCSNAKEERSNFDNRKGPKTPSIQPQARRLSLEGPRTGAKEPLQIKLLDPVSNPVKLEAIGSAEGSKSIKPPRSPIHSPLKVPVKPPRSPIHSPSKVPVKPLRSPIHSPSKVLVQKPDVRPETLQLHQIKTPEPTVKCKNEEGQKNVIKSEQGLLSDLSTTGLSSSSAHGKGSQIRKSLRSIGKLINGSEKRNQQKLTEAVPVSRFPQDPKSPISSNARAQRRQSLTGVLPTESSRRSSLGGVEGNRNSRTPPPALRASTKLTKRWM